MLVILLLVPGCLTFSIHNFITELLQLSNKHCIPSGQSLSQQNLKACLVLTMIMKGNLSDNRKGNESAAVSEMDHTHTQLVDILLL